MIIHNGQELHTYVIEGLPIPWQRPRLSRRTFFDSQKLQKSNYALTIQSQHEGQPFYTKTPFELIVNFYFPIPCSLKPRSREELLGQPYPHKSDLDNLTKFVLDSCNSILFDDDSRCYRIIASKTYDNTPRTEFAIIPYKRIKK